MAEWLHYAEPRVPELAEELLADRNRGFTYLQSEQVQRSIIQKLRVFSVWNLKTSARL